MGIFVKICGLCSEEQVRAVVDLEPDAIGFMLWEGSKRQVDVARAVALAAHVPPTVRKVGVFVDADVADVSRVVESAGLDVVQLHGNEPPEMCDAFEVDVWKAVHLDRPDPLPVDRYRVDAFLIDSYSTQAPGGTGKTCDWDKARAFVESTQTPVILAGGLTPENVQEATAAVRPWGVDVSSGVEARVGVKDLDKVARFIEQCRRM